MKIGKKLKHHIDVRACNVEVICYHFCFKTHIQPHIPIRLVDHLSISAR
jgi:hypothetical protein